MMPRSMTALASAGALSLWGLTVGTSFLLLGQYHARPGDPGSPAEHWPVEAALRPQGAGSQLLLFIDPRCPCSRASLSELAHVSAQCQGRFTPVVVLVKTDQLPQGWSRSGLDRAIAAVPGIQLWDDRLGEETRRFGVTTSGHVLLFDPRGDLRFSGGITPSRGHEGDCYGRDALIGLILGKPGTDRKPPVFGCPVVDPTVTRVREEAS